MCLGHKKTFKKTRIKLYNTLALPVLLYDSETWIIKARDARKITAARMIYMRRTAGYTWAEYKTNTQIAKELKITPILDKLLEYKGNWIQHVNRMTRSRLPRIKDKGKAIPLQAWTGPQGSRRLRFPDFKTIGT